MTSEIFLVIDDDPQVANLFSEAFKANGFRGDVYIDSFEALSVFNKSPNKYRVVICDIRMPGKSGIEAATEIKKLNPSVKVVLMSDDKKDYDNSDSPSKISDHFVIKPKEVGEVVKLMSGLDTAH